MSIISEPIDFLGVNIYHGRYRRMSNRREPEVVPEPLGWPINMMSAPITPEALYWGPKYLYDRYQKPIIITENGMANMDWMASDGKVHDPQRIDFISKYLQNLGRAGLNGVDIKGYFHWSFSDNFEWNEGYSKRFGLVFVDYNTQKRIIKDSGYWYKNIIATNGKDII
jgi:beta-glucosidase